MKEQKSRVWNMRRWFSSLWTTVRHRVHRDVEAATEPIDFSAPSIPYYTGLANRFALARVLLYVILFVFLIVTIVFNTKLITYQNLYYLFKDINAAALTAETPSDYIGYPVSTIEPSFALYRNGLVVVGGEEVTALSASGKQTLSDRVSYASPCVRSSDAYFITFGRGESSFRVYNAFVRVYAEETAYPIYDACIAEGGNFAVVTRAREYKSEVTMYNRDMQKVSSYRTTRYVTGISLSPNGDRLVAVSVGMENGTAYSNIQVIKSGKAEADADVRVPDTVLYRCAFLTSDRFVAMGDTGAWIYDTNGRCVAELDMGGEQVTLGTADTQNERVAFLTQNAGEFSENNLKIFDKNGNLVHTIPVRSDTDVLELSWQDHVAYLRTADEVICVSVRDGQIRRLQIPANVYAVEILKDGSILVCTPSHAYRPEAENWVMDS